MKHNRQFVRVNSDIINKDLSAGAVKVLFLLASIAQAGGGNTAMISNARISARTKLTNITRIMNELYAIGAVTERIQRFKNNRQRCSAYVISDAISTPDNYVFVPAAAVELPNSCLRLLILYCIHANKNGRCLLSLSMIQELSGMARSTIISCNKKLTEQGYIAKQRYVRREGDFGHNRIYISHLIRYKNQLRLAETFRVIINSAVMYYESKCSAECALTGKPDSKFMRAIRHLFRNTSVARFIRKILRSTKNAAVLRCQKWGSLKMITRFINIKPVLLI